LLGDATDRAALRASEQRFRAFMDNAPVLSTILDQDDRAVFLSAPALRALGVGVEAMGLRAEDLLPEAYLAQYRPLIQAARDTGEVQTAVVPLPVNGEVRSVQSQYFRLPGSPGGMVGAISLDVTDALATQRQLADAAREEAALRRVATLVAAEAPEVEVFAVATKEVGRLLAAQTSNMVRFTEGVDAVVSGAWNEPDVTSLPVGTRVTMDGDTALTRVFRTRSPARVDSYEQISGELAARLRAMGLRSSVAAPILLQDRLWGAFTASTTHQDPLPPGTEERIGHFAELVAQALANSEARRELAASRERIIEAADAARRDLERDLHDGAQQRLIALLMQLRGLQRRALRGADLALDLDGVLVELELTVAELRELAHGIHPAILVNAGLPAALRRLAGKCAVPVELSVDLPHRLPAQIEAALYFVTCESLANAQKHSDCSHVTIALTQKDQRLTLEYSDDGPGGAIMRPGGGLEGLRDRVEALSGRLVLLSPPTQGTRIHVELDLHTSSDDGRVPGRIGQDNSLCR
jgi:PAS domain S-box-containing protein